MDPISDHSTHAHGPQSLARRLREATGLSVADCYQCGKCSAGCPLATEMDYPPNQILRMLQLEMEGFDRKVLSSLSIWLCLTCQTCLARCPKEVDLPRVMDFLREESLRLGLVNRKAADILTFHESFIGSVESCGRLHEMGLIQNYKLKTFHFLQDLTVAPKLFLRGKLHPKAHKIEGQKHVAEIMQRVRQKKGGVQ